MTFTINAQLRLLPPTNAARIANQLRQQLNNINATVNVQMSQQGQRNLQKANKNLKQVGATAKKTGDSMSDFGKQAALAGKRFFAFTLATTAVLKLVGAFKSGISDAIKFERELVKISQVTGTSMKSLQDLSSEISRLGARFGTSSSQLIQASRILSQTGLSAVETKKALEALAKSDLAPTFDNIVNTTEGAIAIFRQFGIEAGQLEGALGSINAVASKFAVESSDIIAAVRRTGGAFSAAGGSLEELIALFTSVRSTTRESAESIATGFRTIFTRLQRVRTQNFLESLGIDLRSIEGQFVGPLEAVRRLSTALKNLPGTDPRFAQIIEELGGFRQVSKVIPLIQQFGTAEKALGVAIAGTGSLTRDAAVAQQSLAVQIQQTKEQFFAMIRGFSNTSSFKAMIVSALKLADALTKVLDALRPLVPVLAAIAAIGIGKVVPQIYKGFKAVGGFGLTGLTGRHEGGPIKFQDGGLVPGVGNRDTVPAKLTPGEYVIRKAAVKRIGVDNLQFANKGGPALPHYAEGTKNYIKPEPEKYRQAKAGEPTDEGQVKKAIDKQFGVVYAQTKSKSRQATGLSPIVTNEDMDKAMERQNSNFRKEEYVSLDGSDNEKSSVTFGVSRGFMTKDAVDFVKEDGKKYVNDLLINMAHTLVPSAQIKKDTPVSGYKTMQGFLFEGIVARLGPPFSDELETTSDDRRTWDFPSGIPNDTDAAQLFNNPDLGTIPTDAKLTDNKSSQTSMKRKITNTIADALYAGKSAYGFVVKQGARPVEMAAGGSVNQPNAMLTPGELVVGEDRASQIGLPTLNYINKTGRLPEYAGGGTYGQVFKPKLTSRGRSQYGDVGRKKQYLAQLIEHLEKMLQAGELDNDGKKYLAHLKARKAKGVRHSRSGRYAHRMSGQGTYYLPRPAVFNKGGAFGAIKNTQSRLRGYASGGSASRVSIKPIQHFQTGGKLSNIGTYGFAIAGITSLITTFQGLNETVDRVISAVSSFAAQASLMVIGFRTVTEYFKEFGGKIQAGTEKIAQLGEASKTGQANLKELVGQHVDTKQQIKAQRQAGQAPDQKLLDQEKVLKQQIDTTKKGITATQDEIRVTQANVDANQKLQNTVNYVSIGLGLLAAGAMAAGAYLEKIGRAEIEAGKGSGKFIGGKMASGAGQGAFAGGLIGAQALSKVLGPLWGTVLGAGVGAAGGAVYGGITGKTEAKQIRIMSEFSKNLKGIERTFKNIEKGSTSFDLQRSRINSFIRGSFKGAFQEGVSEDTRRDIFAGVQAQGDKLTAFLQEMAKGSKTLEQFFDSVSQSDFEKLGVLLDIPFVELYQSFEKQIEEQNKLAEKTKELTEFSDKYANQLRNIISLGRAFDTISVSMKRFESSMNAFAAFATESMPSFQVADESAQVLNPADFVDTRGFADIINRDIVRNPALQIPLRGDTPVGQEFGSSVLAVQQAIDTLPGALLYLRNSLGSFDPETTLDQLLAQFNPDDQIVQSAIKRIYDSIVGPTQDTSKFSEALEDVPTLVQKFAEGFKPTTETAGKIVKAMVEEKNRRLQYVEQLNAITQKEIELRSGALDVQRTREELMAKAESRPVNLDLMQQLDRQRLLNLGVGTNPAQIGRKAEEARAKLIELQNKYTKDEIAADTKLVDEQRKYKDMLAKSTMALEHLSDAGSRASVIMEKIEKAQGEVQYRRSLLHRAASIEDPRQAFEMMMELRSARYAAATGTLDVVPMSYRSEVMDLFKDLAERNVDLDVFGGAGSSQKIYNQLLGDFARKIPGLGEEDVRKLMESRTSEIDELKEGLKEVVNIADKAYLERIKLLESAENNLIKQLNQSIIDFGNKLQQLLIEQEIRSTEVARRGEEGKLTSAENRLNNLRGFQDFLRPFMPSMQRPSDDLTIRLAKRLDDIKKLYDMEKARARYGSVVEQARGRFPIKEYQRYTEEPMRYPNLYEELPIESELFRFAYASGAFRNTPSGMLGSEEFERRLLTLSDVIRDVTGDENAARLFRKKVREEQELRGNDTSLSTFTDSVTTVLPKFADELEKTYSEMGSLRADIEHDLNGMELSPEMLNTLGSQFESLSPVVATFKDKDIPALQESVVQFRGSVTDLQGELNRLKELLEEVGKPDIKSKPSLPKPASSPKPVGGQRGGLIGFNKGGVVPGVGNRDTVPAMLTPGEIVLPKMALGGIALRTLSPLLFRGARSAYGAASGMYSGKIKDIEEKERRGEKLTPLEELLLTTRDASTSVKSIIPSPAVSKPTTQLSAYEQAKKSRRDAYLAEKERRRQEYATGRGRGRQLRGRLPDEQRAENKAKAEEIARTGPRYSWTERRRLMGRMGAAGTKVDRDTVYDYLPLSTAEFNEMGEKRGRGYTMEERYAENERRKKAKLAAQGYTEEGMRKKRQDRLAEYDWYNATTGGIKPEVKEKERRETRGKSLASLYERTRPSELITRPPAENEQTAVQYIDDNMRELQEKKKRNVRRNYGMQTGGKIELRPLDPEKTRALLEQSEFGRLILQNPKWQRQQTQPDIPRLIKKPQTPDNEIIKPRDQLQFNEEKLRSLRDKIGIESFNMDERLGSASKASDWTRYYLQKRLNTNNNIIDPQPKPKESRGRFKQFFRGFIGGMARGGRVRNRRLNPEFAPLGSDAPTPTYSDNEIDRILAESRETTARISAETEANRLEWEKKEEARVERYRQEREREKLEAPHILAAKEERKKQEQAKYQQKMAEFKKQKDELEAQRKRMKSPEQAKLDLEVQSEARKFGIATFQRDEDNNLLTDSRGSLIEIPIEEVKKKIEATKEQRLQEHRTLKAEQEKREKELVEKYGPNYRTQFPDSMAKDIINDLSMHGKNEWRQNESFGLALQYFHDVGKIPDCVFVRRYQDWTNIQQQKQRQAFEEQPKFGKLFHAGMTRVGELFKENIADPLAETQKEWEYQGQYLPQMFDFSDDSLGLQASAYQVGAQGIKFMRGVGAATSDLFGAAIGAIKTVGYGTAAAGYGTYASFAGDQHDLDVADQMLQLADVTASDMRGHLTNAAADLAYGVLPQNDDEKVRDKIKGLVVDASKAEHPSQNMFNLFGTKGGERHALASGGPGTLGEHLDKDTLENNQGLMDALDLAISLGLMPMPKFKFGKLPKFSKPQFSKPNFVKQLERGFYNADRSLGNTKFFKGLDRLKPGTRTQAAQARLSRMQAKRIQGAEPLPTQAPAPTTPTLPRQLAREQFPPLTQQEIAANTPLAQQGMRSEFARDAVQTHKNIMRGRPFEEPPIIPRQTPQAVPQTAPKPILPKSKLSLSERIRMSMGRPFRQARRRSAMMAKKQSTPTPGTTRYTPTSNIGTKGATYTPKSQFVSQDVLERLGAPIDTATVDVKSGIGTLSKGSMPTTTAPFKPYTRTVGILREPPVKQLAPSAVTKNPLYPRTLELRKLARAKKMAMEDSAIKLLQDRKKLPSSVLKPEPKMTTTSQMTRRMSQVLEEQGLPKEILPKNIKVLKDTKGLRKYSGPDSQLSDSAHGFTRFFSSKVGLRKGSPEGWAFHELGHMADRGLRPGVTLSTDVPKVSKLLSQFGRVVKQQIAQRGIPISDKYLNYILEKPELFGDIGRQIFSKNSNMFLDLFREITGFQTGAFVPGSGSGDKVPALLEPGEFVLNRNAVQAAGPQNLDQFNKRHGRFQTGGRVGRQGFQEGGEVSGPQSMQMPDFAMLNEIMQIFGNKVDLLAESLNNINGLEIQLTASHKVEVIINGAAVMQQLEPSIQNLVVSETNKAINSMLKNKFPDVGTMD